MTAKNLKIKKHKKMPFNYSLYPVNVIVKDKEIQDESTFPKEFCKEYNGDLLIKPPYKKIIEY